MIRATDIFTLLDEALKTVNINDYKQKQKYRFHQSKFDKWCIDESFKQNRRYDAFVFLIYDIFGVSLNINEHNMKKFVYQARKKGFTEDEIKKYFGYFINEWYWVSIGVYPF